MLLDEKIYIAGNNEDAFLVQDFLNAYGVTDYDSLVECLKYAHWALRAQSHNMSKYFSVGNDLSYSPSELDSIIFTDEINSLQIEETKKPEAAKIMDSEFKDAYKKSDIEADSKKAHLGWFLRKLSGLEGNEDRNKWYKKPKGNISTSDAQRISILKDKTDVHAELKLLKHLATLAINNQEFRNKNVVVAGLKRACKYCHDWIEFYKKWIWNQFKINLTCIDLPNDPRSEGGGAGKRPSLDAESKVFAPKNNHTEGRFVSDLFNGKENGDFTDLKLAIKDDIWWRQSDSD